MKKPKNCYAKISLRDGFVIHYMFKQYFWIGAKEGATGKILTTAPGSSPLRFAKDILKAHGLKAVKAGKPRP